LYALLAPHLGATGYDNRAAIVLYRRRRTLWAEQGPFGAALAAVDEKQRDAVERASVGYVGDSDGWQDFARNGAMTWEYENAGPGNVALMAELPRRVVLALGFWEQRRSGGNPRDLESAAAFRQPAAAAHNAMAGVAGRTQRALRGAARYSACARRRVPGLDGRAPQPSRQDLSRRGGGEPQRSVGRYRQRAWRVSSGMAARSGRDPRRAVGAGGRAGGARYFALPERHPDRGRPLAAEPVAWRQTLLGRDPARRNCLSRASRRASPIIGCGCWRPGSRRAPAACCRSRFGMPTRSRAGA
jgi:hypothetical protein